MNNDIQTQAIDETEIKTGCLRFTIELIIQIFSLGSIFHWLARIWPSHERTPFWFSEFYSIVWFMVTCIGYIYISPQSKLWNGLLIVSIYRIFELGIRFSRIIFFGTRSRKDDLGRYYLVRDPIRWLCLVLVDFIVINICFSTIYLTFGTGFEPPIKTKMAALFQSFGSFISGAGSLPTTNITYAVNIIEFLYVFLILIVVAPIVLSVIRAREQTDEKLGDIFEM